MATFFNGRKLVTPTVASRIDDSALANSNPAVGNALALIGRAGGGQPKTPLKFGSPSEAAAVLREGELLEAVKKAFAPSPETGAPATVMALRVNPAAQSLATLFDATNNPAVELKSTDYGLYTSQIKVKVEDGTNRGKKITTQHGEDYYSADDIGRDALSIQYIGAEAAATVTVSNTELVLSVAGAAVKTIDLNVYPTIQQLVDAINAVADFSARVLDANGNKPAVNGLDSVADQDVLAAAYTVKADLQAVVDWFNGIAEGYVTATRPAAATAVPVNVDWQYLTGGSDGVVTNEDWADCFTALQTEDVQWLAPLTSDEAVHAMADAHVDFMSKVAQKERRAFVGGPIGQTFDEVKTAAKALNSDRTAPCYAGYYDYNANGKLTLFAPYMTAAIIAAGFAGSDPGTAMTNKALNIRGVEKKLRNPTDTDELIEAGVLCINETETGFKVVRSVSSWLNDENYNRVEISCGAALDYTARVAREAIADLVGQGGNPLALSEAVSRTETALSLLSVPAPRGPGVLVGDEENPPYRNVRAHLDGDVIAVQFEASPVIPINYALVSIYAKPYAGSASA
ncbi:MAG TPA: phage tail sheath subtilisin-like domain-containing protein [Gammaproteobacteria bacterium]|nr:phage tail sheath subtilisin-like domain-containing protein [Gammaproteobacteria bacterium]